MDKTNRLLDAIEHPEHYNSEEIEAMLNDPEVKKTLDLLDKTNSSLRTIDIPDIEKEWERFETVTRNYGASSRFMLKRLLSRNVAASVTIGLLSFTAVAAMIGIGLNRLVRPDAATPYEEAGHESIITVTGIQSASNAIHGQENAMTQEIIVFDDETLETILSKMGEYYGYKVIFNSDTSKSLRLYFRWDRALTMKEVGERLNNFERIHLRVNDTTINVD